MRHGKITLSLVLGLATCLGLTSSAPAFHAGKEHKYAVVLLSPLGAVESAATAISASGHVVGWWRAADGTRRGFRWTPTTLNPAYATFGQGTMETLQPLAVDPTSYASDVNSLGHVVGYSGEYTNQPNPRRAVLWTGTAAIDLGVPSRTATKSFAHGINESGLVVGSASTPGAGKQAFLWTPTAPNDVAGSFTNLGSPLGGNAAEARAINAAGTIVGVDILPGAPPTVHGIRWSGGVPTVLTPGAATTINGANAVNALGNAVGFSGVDGFSEAAVWSFSNLLITIGTLPPYSLNSATAINGPNRVVGGGFTLDGDGRAFRWHPSVLDLEDINDLVTSDPLVLATGVNDDGVVVGQAEIGSGDFAVRVPFVAAPFKAVAAVYGGLGRSFVSVSKVPYLKVCDPTKICEQITITNVSKVPVAGPFHVVAGGLARGQALANAMGTYHQAPFVTIPRPALKPGQAATAILVFDRARDGRLPIYDVTVLAGEF
jgi:probable HAF family extracellular repeat protein